jgi:BA14K-like protein
MRTGTIEFGNRALNRVLGAVAIAFAGVLLGFAAGRLSAWVVPPAGMQVATSSGATSKPAIPLEPAHTPKSTPSRPENAPPGATGTAEASPKPPSSADAREGQSTSADAKPQVEATDKVAPSKAISRALSPAEPEARVGTGPADRDVTVIIPGGPPKQERPAPTRVSEDSGSESRAIATSSDSLERCRRKYRSFDPVDGTYKPYGQDVRVPCPHLR